MQNNKASLIVMSAVLLVITVIDVVIAIKNIMTDNLITGILLLVMAAIILATAIRDLIIYFSKR